MGILQEGQIIRGTWEVERFLGEGAFAEVYRVKHRFLGRQAMKVFKIIDMSIDEVENALGEAILLSQLSHPNIIKVFDANTMETSHGIRGFFTMEYVAGGSLEKFWHSHGTKFVPINTTIDIIRQVCRGISLAHSEKPPIIHRDIKPQNILIGYDAVGIRVHVSDFGLAKHVNPLTLLASARGTPKFKAPEVFKDFQCDSCAGDVWAIGTTLYLLLTDRLPFVELGDPGFEPSILERPIIPPSSLNFNVDPSLDQITLRALTIDPKGRYPTAKEFLADLEKWMPPHLLSGSTSSNSSSDKSKSALGPHSPANYERARKMASDAVRLAQSFGKLSEAADMMEEACNNWPSLREKYEYVLRLWRRGHFM